MKKNFIICPFNSNHKIQSSKLEHHILKSHPNEQNQLLYCVNNASCKFFKKDKEKHFMKCIDCMKKYTPNNYSQITLNDSELSKKMEYEKTFISDPLNVTSIKQFIKENSSEEKEKSKNEEFRKEIINETIIV